MTKAGKDKYEEAVSKKAKRGNSHMQVTEGGKSLRKIDAEQMQEDSLVRKVEEKNKGSKKNAVNRPQEGTILHQALSTHPETQTSSNEPQQEEKTFEKTPTKF